LYYLGVTMRLPTITIIAILLLVVTSFSGCVSNTPKKGFYSDETLTITITSTYKGNYSAWVPTLYANGTDEVAPIFYNLQLKEPYHGLKVVHLGPNETEEGPMERLDIIGDVSLIAERHVRSKSLPGTNDYTFYRWSSGGVYNTTDKLRLVAKAQMNPGNDTTSQTLHLVMDYTGKSDYCSLHKWVSGDIQLKSNTWSIVIGDEKLGDCTR
jgi:hypothetical protein